MENKFNSHYLSGVPKVITINFWKFYSTLVKEPNLIDIVETMEELQEFAYNEEEYTKKWESYLQEFDNFCEKKLQNPNLSPLARSEFSKIIKDIRHNLEISIKYSSIKNRSISVIGNIKNRCRSLIKGYGSILNFWLSPDKKTQTNDRETQTKKTPE